MNSVDEIKEQIYKYPKSRKIYRDNTYPALCFKFLCMAEKLFIFAMSPQQMLADPNGVGRKQDDIRHGLREILKWAYRFSDGETGSFSIPAVTDSDIKSGLEELSEAIVFNPIRKSFEDQQLMRYSAEIDNDNSLVFSINKTSRDLGYEVYAKWADSEKPEDQLNSEKNFATAQALKLMVDPRYNDKWDAIKNKPINQVAFQKFYEVAYQKVLSDCEEKGDYQFEFFTMENYRRVYAAIMALGMMKFNSQYANFLPQKKKGIAYDLNRPIVYGNIVWLKNYICKFLKDISLEEIEKILEYMAYDGGFHQDKITILQPIFVFGKAFFFSPTFVYLSMQQDKLFYLIKERKESKSVITHLAHDREKIMTKQIVDEIKQKSTLQCCTNLKLMTGATSNAEFDIVIYDPLKNKVLLTELKWYFKFDGGMDRAGIDLKIKDAIKLRKERELLATKRISEILSNFETEKTNVTPPEIMSCVVSKNYSGSPFLEDNLPVFDQFLFLTVLEETNFDLSVLFERIKSKTCVPSLEEMQMTVSEKEVQYAECKVKYPIITYQNLRRSKQ